MFLSLLALAGTASFACVSPSHHDGDNVRCANVEQSIRLQGIDAPEMPGSCRPGRVCTPGDPFAARDTLIGLTAGRDVRCTAEGEDVYGRIIARCRADGVDLSCAMIASGQAVPRYAAIDCPGGAVPAGSMPGVRAGRADPQPAPPVAVPVIVPAALPVADAGIGWLPVVLLWLLLINGATWAIFAIDKRRAEAGRRRDRVSERVLLGLAMVGGSPAGWHAIDRSRRRSSKDRFRSSLIVITGLQIGAMLGGMWWLLD